MTDSLCESRPGSPLRSGVSFLGLWLGGFILTLGACLGDQSVSQDKGTSEPSRWTAQEANAWYGKQPWLVGFNFLPSTAVNDTEMWQKESFDPETMDRELGWAHDAGYNSCRVFLQFIVWQADPEGFKKRFDHFLGLADGHGLSVMPILFDDCDFAGKDPYLGKQDDPIPGVHNSGWVPSPAHKMVDDPRTWGELEKYVKDVVGSFAQDKRVVIWDLYNEPSRSLKLVEATFRWARQARPSQPLTTCVFGRGEMPKRIAELSDIINFHNYADLGSVRNTAASLRSHGRPIICSEWMARVANSRFASHLPFFKKEKIGCYNWGLVAGKIQTYYPWGSRKGSPDPKPWHHDVFRKDGTPYDAGEILTIRRYARNLEPKVVVATSEEKHLEWRYTLQRPADDWFKADFDDSRWAQAPAPFGTKEPAFDRDPPTEWKTADIWLRRTFETGDARLTDPLLRIYHDEDAEVYINGVLAASPKGYTASYTEIPLTPEGRAALKPGKNVFAVHCRQRVGGQYIDVGIVDLPR